MNNIDPKLKELKASIETIGNEIKAMPEKNDMMDKMHQMMSSMYNYVDYVLARSNERINACENKMYDHMASSSHLPPIKGAGKMQKALKTLGLDDDYEAIKIPLYSYASVKKGPLTVEAEYKKN